MDTRIIAYVTKALQKELGKSDKIDLALQATLKEAAEEAKIALSTEESTQITIPFVAENRPPFTMELTRQTLESLIQDLIERTRAPMERALHDASLEKMRSMISSLLGNNPDTSGQKVCYGIFWKRTAGRRSIHCSCRRAALAGSTMFQKNPGWRRMWRSVM